MSAGRHRTGFSSRGLIVGRRYAGDRASFALVLVLAALALISILIIGFFASIQIEVAMSRSYQATGAARSLAASALNLAIAQIREATSNPTNAWASQPGMIRSYSSSSPMVTTYYRLYSWNAMQTNSFNATSEAQSLAGWSASPALYTDLNEPASIHGNVVYPIVDYNAALANNVGGFYLTNTPVGAPSASTTQPCPMPVQWLYILRNGQVIAPDAGSSGNTATFNNSTVTPSASNPIVGRIAFWADDECSKVDINTASDEQFWDTPRAAGMTETNLATYQPAVRQFQRFPGNPETTSLSAVFPSLSQAQIYAMCPAVANYTVTNAVPPSGGVTNKTDRLYASVDDLLYTPARASNGLTESQVNAGQFFLTAYNRAPEVNLFNRPRISLWPIDQSYATSHSNTNRVTYYDQLLSFCSTMTNNLGGNSDYFYQRSNPVSPTYDISIPRNQQIYSYLQYLTSLSVPGFGGESFQAKYPAGPASIDPVGATDCNQLLTEMFDYIRTVNLADYDLAAANRYAPVITYITNMPPIGKLSAGSFNSGGGLVAPTVYNGTRGFGRFDTITGAFLWLIGVADSNTDPDGNPWHGNWTNASPGGAGWTVPSTNNPAGDSIRVQAVVGLNFADPAYGWSSAGNGLDVESTGVTGFQWGTNSATMQSMGMKDGDLVYDAQQTATRSFGGRQGPMGAVYGGVVPLGNQYPTPSPIKAVSWPYPWYSTTLDVPLGTNIIFSGGSVKFSVYYNTNYLQTVNITFPSSTTFPSPGLAAYNEGGTNFAFPSGPNGPQGSTTPNPVTYYDWRYFSHRFQTYNLGLFDTHDTIEHVEMNSTTDNGDYRLIAGLANVPSNYYAPHPLYGTASHFAHRLWNAAPYFLYGATYGSLVPGVSYDSSGGFPASYPSYSGTAWWGDNPSSGVYAGGGNSTIPGDWDNGWAGDQDGPNINKVDEGDTYGLQNTPTTPPYFGANTETYTNVGPTYFSPNRQMPSAGMFGSLPTGVERGLPYQTLLFRPEPIGHPGLGTSSAGGGDSGPPYTIPPDHLFMDLYWMPAVEPYAISEPFSTAGKVNLNYQIVPFTYIQRETGLWAVLKNEQIMAIPNTAGPTYKNFYAYTQPSYRFPINVNETLNGFRKRFSNNDIFHSASEICENYLVPTMSGATYNSMPTFWNSYRLTGDNTREHPYATIYPRVTTQSNTYLIHYRAQALQKVPTSSASQWVEGTDQIVGEYRGSSLVERYIDPNDSTLPDFVQNMGATVNPYYRYRVVYTKQVGQ